MKDQWQGFERALYGLQQRRCFTSLREYLSVKQRIAASISAPAADALFYRYGYGPGGYVDLTPGMQLQIERDFFGVRTPEQPPHANYRGTTVTYYKLSGDAGSGTKLMFLKTEKRSMGATTPEVDTSDVTLATEFEAAPRLRLFLENLAVSGNDKSPAMLIGAPIAQDLNEATQAIESDPRISCEALLRWHVTCAFFSGIVTVSPMLQISSMDHQLMFQLVRGCGPFSLKQRTHSSQPFSGHFGFNAGLITNPSICASHPILRTSRSCFSLEEIKSPGRGMQQRKGSGRTLKTSNRLCERRRAMATAAELRPGHLRRNSVAGCRKFIPGVGVSTFSELRIGRRKTFLPYLDQRTA